MMTKSAMNDRQNVPYDLYGAAPADFLVKCGAETDRDVRHLGRYLTFAYTCPNCGPRHVELSPDFPYSGPNSTWTCSHCAGVMHLDSVVPVVGTPKSVTLTSKIRGVVANDDK
jgi:ribosomal protein L37AE/L43A